MFGGFRAKGQEGILEDVFGAKCDFIKARGQDLGAQCDFIEARGQDLGAQCDFIKARGQDLGAQCDFIEVLVGTRVGRGRH